MADDREDDRGDGEGRRQDGKPYKEGNTRADGSYGVGKYRTPEDTRFKKGDGRERGKRATGSKNVDKVWEKQLAKKATIKGVTQSKLEWVVEGTIQRAVGKSDRAAEIVMERAERLEARKERRLALTQREILDAWFAQQRADDTGSISDDADVEDGHGDVEGPDADEANDADQ